MDFPERARYSTTESDFILERAYERREHLILQTELRSVTANQNRLQVWEEIRDALVYAFRKDRSVDSIKDHFKYRKLALKKRPWKWMSYLRMTAGGIEEEVERQRDGLIDLMGYGDFLLARMYANTPSFIGEPTAYEAEAERQVPECADVNYVSSNCSSLKRSAPQGAHRSRRDQENTNSQARPLPLVDRTDSHSSAIVKDETPCSSRDSSSQPGASSSLFRPNPSDASGMNGWQASGCTTSVEDSDNEVISEPRLKRRNPHLIYDRQLLQEMRAMYKAQKKAFEAQTAASTKMLELMTKMCERLDRDQARTSQGPAPPAPVQVNVYVPHAVAKHQAGQAPP